MGCFKLIFLIPLFSLAQIPSDVKHFYASMAVNEAAYQIQSFACPKWRNSTKLVVSNLTTLAVGIAKELYDKRSTGFSKDDLGMDIWSMPVYTIVRICINDWKGKGDKYEIKYYYFDRLGYPNYN